MNNNSTPSTEPNPEQVLEVPTLNEYKEKNYITFKDQPKHHVQHVLVHNLDHLTPQLIEDLLIVNTGSLILNVTGKKMLSSIEINDRSFVDIKQFTNLGRNRYILKDKKGGLSRVLFKVQSRGERKTLIIHGGEWREKSLALIYNSLEESF